METKAAKDLEKELLFSQPHISDEWPAAREEAEAFCEDYKAFLNNAKTEREAAAEIEKRLVAAGYRPFGHMAKTALKPGDKVDSVRDLAMRFGVNPNTVQRSLAELEREGLLKSERTVGRFISENEELINLTREQMAFSCVSRYVREMRTLGFNGEQVLEQTRYYVKEKMNDDGE